MAVASLQIIDTFHTKTARSILHVKICVQHLPGRFFGATSATQYSTFGGTMAEVTGVGSENKALHIATV
jgi:hypothetical protein